jgi:hypothetical protein
MEKMKNLNLKKVYCPEVGGKCRSDCLYLYDDGRCEPSCMRQDVLMMFHPDNDSDDSSDFIRGMQRVIEDIIHSATAADQCDDPC